MASLKKIGLSTQIGIALLCGVLFGWLMPDWGASLKPIGDMFIRLIKMIVVPLIFSTLVVGISGTGDFKKMGRLGIKAIIWFEFATTIALFVGLLAGNILQPGIGVDLSAINMGAVQEAAAKTASQKIDMVQFLVNIVPTNIVDGMARSDMLQIILFSAFFGVACAAAGEKGKPVYNVANGIAEVMFKVTHYVMTLAPIGVFALISYTVGKYGLSVLIPLAKLIGTLYLSIVFFMFIVLFLASLMVKVKFIHLLRALKEPIILSFTTSSSEAALPLAMERLEQFGIPKHVVSFVLPTGYSFNLDGSTLYCTLASLFIAQVFGIHMPLSQQLLMVLMFMFSSKGIAGVPGASLIVIAATSVNFGLPAEGIALLLGIDRIMDMARTVCNLLGNCVATVIVARWEKELSDEDLELAYARSYDDDDATLI